MINFRIYFAIAMQLSFPISILYSYTDCLQLLAPIIQSLTTPVNPVLLGTLSAILLLSLLLHSCSQCINRHG